MKRILFCALATLALATPFSFAQQAATKPAESATTAPAVIEAKLFADLIKWLPRPADAPAQPIIKPEDTFVIIGDSITAGGGYLKFTDQTLAAADPKFSTFKTINAGVSGHKAENLIARYQKDVLDKKPTIVAICIGINDVWHRLKAPHDDAVLAKYKENVASMVTQAQAANAKVILLAPTVIQEDPESEGNKRLPLYVNAMKEIAAEKKCQFMDLHGMFIESLKHKPADAQGNWLTGDGVHMKPLGNAVMALGVLRALGIPDAKIADTTLTYSPPRPRTPKTQPATKPATPKIDAPH